MKAGYKQIRNWEIPIDWEEIPFAALCKTFTKQTGFDYSAYIKPKLVKDYVEGVIPFIQNKDFDGKKVNFNTDYYIPEKEAKKFPKILLDEKCLLMSISGSIGNVGLFDSSQKAFLGGAIAVAKFIDEEQLDWVLYYFLSDIGQDEMLRNVKAGAHHNLILDDIRKSIILLPKPQEQSNIVKVLSDTDELISSLEKLIEKKKLIKQGTMQLLLTGKKRLPGFSGEWVVKTIEQICIPNGVIRGPFGGSLKKEFFVDNGIKVYEQRNAIYRTTTLGTYYINQNKYIELKRFEINPGDFIISCSGTIGKIFRIPENAPKGIINQALLLLKVDSQIVEPNYFYYYFDWDKFQTKIIDSTQGGAMKNLVGMEVFKKTEMILPPTILEQQNIAQIFKDIDIEIESLEHKLNKYKSIKQGMMQNLLTGKIRLV